MTPLQAICLGFGELSTGQIDAWSGLLAAWPANRRAFLSPGYCRAVAAVNPRVRVALFLREGRVAGVLPFQWQAGVLGALRIAEPVGGVMSDYFGLVAEPSLRVDVPTILRATGASAIEFSHLDETQAAFGFHGEDPRTGLRTLIGPSGEDYWRQLRVTDKKLVADTERRERKLEAEQGALRFELHARDAIGDLDRLIRLKTAQYQRTGRHRAPLFTQPNVDLLFSLLSRTDPDCTGVLSVLRVGERLVGAHFGLRCHDTLHFWFPVYDADFAAYSPGRILLKHVIMAGAREGMRVIDRGEGDTPAKRDFANESHLYFRGLWVAPGPRGIAARVAIGAAWRLRR